MSAALPLRVFPPLFNRYQGGHSFGNHVDNAIRQITGTALRIRTDLSATLFLAQPGEYDGGELVVEDTYGVHSVKLPAGHLLPRLFEPQGDESIPDEIHQATDLVDEGLALARTWEQEGVTSFRDLADDLFRFGARLYGRYQPQFLVEFLGDNTDRSS